MIDDFKNGILNSEMFSFNPETIKTEDLIELEKNGLLTEHVLF